MPRPNTGIYPTATPSVHIYLGYSHPHHPGQFVVIVCLQGNELVRPSIEKLHDLHVNQSSRTLTDGIEINTAQTSPAN
jgi:hypothetical protein